MADVNRRAFVGGLALANGAVGIAGLPVAHDRRLTPSSFDGADSRAISVTDFGAKGDGVTDDTEAFNRATRAAEPWSDDLTCNIRIPAGRYRIDGTVYVRKGQSLCGEGFGTFIDASKAKAHTFVLGKRQAGNVDDPGGAPVKLSNLRSLGGADRHGVVYTNAQGFVISDLFISSAGIGIEVQGADGIISDVAIDQGLNGIVISASQNVILENLNIYLVNYAITFNTSCNDIVISNCVVCYAKHSAVLFAYRASEIRSVIFSGCVFVSNVQEDSFLAFVYNLASNVEVQFTGCSFRNWKDYAVRQAGGERFLASFNGCVFDGGSTNKLYSNSSTAKGLSTGAKGAYLFTGCEFRRLYGEIVRINDQLTSLQISGGAVVDCDPVRLKFANGRAARVSIKAVEGFMWHGAEQGRPYGLLPWWAESTAWRVSISGVLITSDGTETGFAEEAVYAVTLEKNGRELVATCQKAPLWHVPVSMLDATKIAGVAGMGPSPGGKARAILTESSGAFCVAFGSAAVRFRDVIWSAETI